MGRRGPKPRFKGVACPNPECSDYGIKGKGNITGNGTYKTKSGRMRKYICHTCDRIFCDRTNTAFYDLRTEEEKILMALKLVLKGLSLRSISEVMNVKADTVSRWLSKAAEHSEDVNKILLKDLKISKVELDELWTFVKKRVPRMIEYEDDGTWVWISFASECRLVLAHVVRERKQYVANKLIGITKERLASLPLFVSDGLKFYAKALLRSHGQRKRFFPIGRRGRPRKPKVIPRNDLKYAKILKQRENGCLKKVAKKLVFGKDVESQLISTSLIERLNLTLRQDNNRLSRKTIGFSKKIEKLEAQMALYFSNFNFCRAHEPLNNRDTDGKVVRNCPAKEYGLIDHNWSLRELLTYPYYIMTTD